jgi:hypothetical protein
MNEYEYINDAIAREAAYAEGYEAGKQAVIEQIFANIENTLAQWIQLYYNISVSTFDSIEAAKAVASESVLRAINDYVAELKKKYEVK